MKNTVTLMLVALMFLGGYSVSLLVHAQNTTGNYAPVVDSTSALITSITSMVIAVAGIVGMLVKAGILKKEIGTKDFAQNTYDTIKISSPEVAQKADEKLAPILNQATKRIDEYTDKVDKFAEIGKVLSKSGEKTTDDIKENKALKDDIPNEIVPS
jgi:polyhydroxyalkanoate synthesis regulator phasin